MFRQYVIFTDLDGTLLDGETYSPSAALEAVELAKKLGVPIIFCSSKTRAEQLFHRETLGINDPFIVEDGGAIYFEKNYFPFEMEKVQVESGLGRIVFGTSYDEVGKALDVIRAESQLALKGYSDLSVEEVAEATGLDRDAASRAKQREFEETIVSPLGSKDVAVFSNHLARRKLRLSKGSRFHAVLGNHDKGMAVRRLTELFVRKLGKITTVGIGDSGNDLPMLSAVELPVLVQKYDGSWEDCDLPNLTRVPAIGPTGWAAYVTRLLT